MSTSPTVDTTPRHDDAPAPEGFMLPVALIPAYKPTPGLLGIVRELGESGTFHAIVCVDDGSGMEYRHLFDALEGMGVTVLRHATNLGKGNALKTGINHIAVNHPEAVGAVTLDADGQHLAKDCIAVAKALQAGGRELVLGVRAFDGESVPFRSRFGNTVTRSVARFLAGVDITDTQTGLRGIPSFLFTSLLRLKSGGYDFELDMLMTVCEQKIPLRQLPIETVYIANNATSSFNPFWDSIKIYMVFLRFNISALLTFAIDYLVFGAFFALSSSVGLSIVFARLCAGAFNYTVNREIVFRSTQRHSVTLLLYALTVLLMGSIAYVSIKALAASGTNVYAAKIFIECVLFLFSFIIQRELIFTKQKDAPGEMRVTDWCTYYDTRSTCSDITSKLAFASFKKDMARFAPGLKSLVELGGANSIFYDRFKSLFPHARLSLVDRCAPTEAFARKISGDPNTAYIQRDILQDDLTEYHETADCVISFGLIEHFDEADTATMIDRHFALARPGGTVYISFPTPTWLYRLTRGLLEFIGRWPFHDERPLTFDEVLRTASRHGTILKQGMSYRLGLTQGIVVVRK